jgi:transcriptional regulator with XRE-family HTH domain
MNHNGAPAPLPQGIGKRPGQVAKERLKQMNRTQKWLADQTGYDLKTISVYLNGHQAMLPNLVITQRICRFLKLSLNELYSPK